MAPKSANVAGTITPKAITGTGTIGGTTTKVYDGGTTATRATLSGSLLPYTTLFRSNVDFAPVSLAYNTAHVGTATSISATGTAGFTISTTGSSSVEADYS